MTTPEIILNIICGTILAIYLIYKIVSRIRKAKTPKKGE